jgi:hypothetical protein
MTHVQSYSKLCLVFIFIIVVHLMNHPNVRIVTKQEDGVEENCCSFYDLKIKEIDVLLCVRLDLINKSKKSLAALFEVRDA